MAEIALAVISAVAGTLQFALSLKGYISERKRRKQEQAEWAQQQYHNYLHNPPLITSTPATIIYYSISTYSFPAHQHVVPGAYYHQPSSPHAPQQYYLHPPLPLPITSSPPQTINSALSFQDLAWPPYTSKPVLIHQNTAPASLYSCYHNPHQHLHRGASMSRIDDDRWRSYLHGRMHVHEPDYQALQEGYGRLVVMHSGACLINKPRSCFDHWMSLQVLSTVKDSIAVVDWSRGNIYMFVEVNGVYFMNYHISNCEVSTFGNEFRARQVFSGKIKGQKLESSDVPMEMVDLTSTNVHSTNSWRSLGINDESEDMEEFLREGGSFVRMLRGAVLGLVCSLYEAPSHLSVEMERVASHLEIMRVIGQPLHINRQDECIFSVFSFGTNGWASEDILFG